MRDTGLHAGRSLEWADATVETISWPGRLRSHGLRCRRRCDRHSVGAQPWRDASDVDQRSASAARPPRHHRAGWRTAPRGPIDGCRADLSAPRAGERTPTPESRRGGASITAPRAGERTPTPQSRPGGASITAPRAGDRTPARQPRRGGATPHGELKQTSRRHAQGRPPATTRPTGTCARGGCARQGQ
jgi:hypothetical protein